MIGLFDYLRQHATQWPPEVEEAAQGLLEKVNALLEDAYCPSPDAGLRSGYRPYSYNVTVMNAKPNSKHQTGHAVDIDDDNEAIDAWLTDEILEKYELYREHPSATPSWCHLQDVPPGSGKRTFYP